LRLKLFPALGYGDGVGEDGVVLPELQLGERWSAGEQVKHRGDKSSLLAPVLVVEDILVLGEGDGVEWYPVEKIPTADWIEGYAAEVLLVKRAT
jgi:hypothetical protein